MDSYTPTPRKARPTISVVQYLMRRDQMRHGLRSIRSFDAAWGLLSDTDKHRVTLGDYVSAMGAWGRVVPGTIEESWPHDPVATPTPVR